MRDPRGPRGDRLQVRAGASAWMHRLRRSPRPQQGRVLLGHAAGQRTVPGRWRGRPHALAVGARCDQAPHLHEGQDASRSAEPALRESRTAGKLSFVQTIAAKGALVVAGVELRSRLFVGTGKYATNEAMVAAL